MPTILSTSGFPRTGRPAIYARVDASALAGGAADSGNIAIVGDFPSFPSAEPVLFSSRRAMTAYDQSDRELSMLAQLAFNPSSDPLANRGASSVRMVNSRTSGVQASIALGPLTIKSSIYGARGNTTRATLAINGTDHKLTIDRGGQSEEFNGSSSAVATITNDSGSSIDVDISNGSLIVTQGATQLLNVTTDQASDLRAAIVLINNLEGISATLIEPSSIALDQIDLVDLTIADSASANILATAHSLLVELASSQLVSATIDTTSSNALAAGTIHATGGSVGQTLDTATALASIENESVQIVVLHDFTEGNQILLLSHLSAAARAGYERQAYCAIQATNNLAAVKSRAAKLNSADIALTCQDIKLFDAQGQISERDSRFTALMLAGMQAGSDTGEPLTRKRPTIISTKQAFDPHADVEQAITSGTVIITQGPVGLRVERGITTYLTDKNPIFSEISTYESVLTSLRDIRNALEDQIGRPTKASQIPLIESRVQARLAVQVRDGIIKAFGAVQLEDLGDQVAVSYDVAPVEPLNFITLTAVAQRIN